MIIRDTLIIYNGYMMAIYNELCTIIWYNNYGKTMYNVGDEWFCPTPKHPLVDSCKRGVSSSIDSHVWNMIMPYVKVEHLLLDANKFMENLFQSLISISTISFDHMIVTKFIFFIPSSFLSIQIVLDVGQYYEICFKHSLQCFWWRLPK